MSLVHKAVVIEAVPAFSVVPTEVRGQVVEAEVEFDVVDTCVEMDAVNAPVLFNEET